jgi:hypothetical protein
MEWQPIKTAPRDGTWVLLYFDGWDTPSSEGQPTIYVGQWPPEDHWRHDGTWYVDWGDLTQYHIGPPTHWMPVPEPPKVAECAEVPLNPDDGA